MVIANRGSISCAVLTCVRARLKHTNTCAHSTQREILPSGRTFVNLPGSDSKFQQISLIGKWRKTEWRDSKADGRRWLAREDE